MSQRIKVSLLLSASILVVFIYLLARIWDHTPSVSPDEYIHAKFARFTNLAEVEIPSYLYYAVYRVTASFNDQFLNAARVLNALFYVAGCYLVYLVARRFITEWLACYVAIIAVMSPYNTYINYFMPEAIFFFFYWLFVLTLTYKELRYSYKGNMLIGAVFGALLLVKPHALIAISIYPLASFMVNNDRYASIYRSIVFVTVALFVKFSVSYLIAGTGGITLFGSMYARHVSDILSGTIVITYTMKSFIVNIFGNIIALVSVFGLSLVYLFLIKENNNTEERNRFIKWLILFTLIVFVPFVSIFATTTALFDVNINYRIYMRYYNYAFPLIYIYALTHWDESIKLITRSERIGLVTIVIAPIVYIVYHYSTSLRMLPFMVLDNDTPGFFLQSYNSLTLYCTLTTSIIITISWIWRPRQALKYFFYIYVPLLVIMTSINNFKSIQGKNIATTADQAGIAAASIIPKADHGKVLVLGTHDLELTRFLLYLNSGSCGYLVIGENDIINIRNFNPNVRWVVTIGYNGISDDATMIYKSDGYAIFRVIE